MTAPKLRGLIDDKIFSMPFTDTHTHLYAAEFDSDRKEMITRAIEQGIEKFFLPAIDSSYTTAMLETKSLFPDRIFLMAGLHPCSVKEDYKEELKKVEIFMGENHFSGIGETGLDLYWDKTFEKEQVESLHLHIEWALKFNKPVILHTRNANKETIEIIQQYKSEGLRGIFHCFSGTVEEAHQIITLGFFLGIGGVLTFKNSGLDKVIQNIGIDHIVLETDSPYLAPVPYRGKRNESAYLPLIAQKLADVKGMSTAKVAEITNENARSIFDR